MTGVSLDGQPTGGVIAAPSLQLTMAPAGVIEEVVAVVSQQCFPAAAKLAIDVLVGQTELGKDAAFGNLAPDLGTVDTSCEVVTDSVVGGQAEFASGGEFFTVESEQADVGLEFPGVTLVERPANLSVDFERLV